MKKLLPIIFSLLTVITLQAQIIHVPADYPTIQKGINAANPGDTVIVSQGIYYEQINYKGKKPLTVASQFLVDGDTSHIANTVIDGSHYNDTDSLSVIYFISGEDTTSVLCGFTIRGGQGTVMSGADFRMGGGIYIAHSGAKILHNHITANKIDDSSFTNGINAVGAGIGTSFEESDTWVVIENNLIDSNYTVSKTDFSAGAGISVSYNAKIAHNEIVSNWSLITSETGQSLGSGIYGEVSLNWANTEIQINYNTISRNYSLASPGSSSNAWGAGIFIYGYGITIGNNIISGNSAKSINYAGGGGIGIQSNTNGFAKIKGNTIENNICQGANASWGGGILFLSSTASCKSNLIQENYALDTLITSGSYIGGGIALSGCSTGSEIIGNEIFDNFSSKWGGGVDIDGNASNYPEFKITNNYFIGNKTINGGAIFDNNAILTLNNNVFYSNNGITKGGALYLKKLSNAPMVHLSFLVNNSFFENYSTAFGGAIFSEHASPVIFNSIFWQDSAGLGKEIYQVSVDTAEIAFSDIDQGGIVGNFISDTGNIAVDPYYSNPESLFLFSNSPCIDAGSSAYTCHHGENFQAPVTDIEGNLRPAGDGYDMGAWDQEAGVGMEELAGGRRQEAVRCYPNPFSGFTKVEYDLEKNCEVSLIVADQLGQVVKVIVNEHQACGKHQVQWEAGELPGGVYYLRLSAGNRFSSAKVIIIK